MFKFLERIVALKRLTKKILEPEVLVCLLFFLFLLLIFFLFSRKGIINVGDINFPVDLQYHLQKFGYSWQYSASTGKDTAVSLNYNSYFFIIAFFKFFGLGMATAQAISLTLLFFGAFFFFFLLVRRGFNFGTAESFVSAFFYVLNPFFVAQWYVPIPWNLSVLVVVPLCSFLIVKFWEKYFKLFFFLFLSFLFFSYANANIPLLLVMFLSVESLVIVFSCHQFHCFKAKQIILISLVLVLSFLFANFWWLLQPLSSLNSVYSIYTSTTDPLTWLTGISKISTLPNILSLRFVVPFNKTDLSFVEYLPFFFSWPIGLLSFAFILTVFFVPLVLRKHLAKSTIPVFLFFLLSIFLVKAKNPPFEGLFLFLFKNIPFFNLFKSAPEKFGVWYIFLFSFLLALTLNLLRQHRAVCFKYVIVFLSLVLVLFAYPLYSLKLVPMLLINKMKISPFFSEPAEYQNVRNYLNNDPRYSRVFSLSGTLNYVVTNDMHNGSYFRGFDPIANNSKPAFIQPYNYEFGLGSFLAGYAGSENLYKILPVYDVDYVLINADSFNYEIDYSPPSIEKISSFRERYQSVAGKFGNLHLYRLLESYDLPKIYTGQRKILAMGPVDIMLNLPNLIDWQLSDEVYSPFKEQLIGMNIASFDDVLVKGIINEISDAGIASASAANPRIVYNINIPVRGVYETYQSQIGKYGLYKSDEKLFESGEQSLVFTSDFLDVKYSEEAVDIKNAIGFPCYMMYLDYRSPGKDTKFFIEGKGVQIQGVLDKTEGSSFGKFKEYLFYSPLNMSAIEKYFTENPDNLDVKNFQVKKVYQPQIVLKLIRPIRQEVTYFPPKLTFARINPTKYKIKVEEASGPYSLIFAESFSRGWKVYVLPLKKENNLFDRVTKSYFDNRVLEGVNQSRLFNRYIFETWGKPSLPEERHLLVNGYANLWKINPEDSSGNKNYEIILEYRPQRLFYLGFFVTLLVLMGGLCYYLLLMRKQKMKT